MFPQGLETGPVLKVNLQDSGLLQTYSLKPVHRVESMCLRDYYVTESYWN